MITTKRRGLCVVAAVRHEAADFAGSFSALQMKWRLITSPFHCKIRCCSGSQHQKKPDSTIGGGVGAWQNRSLTSIIFHRNYSSSSSSTTITYSSNRFSSLYDEVLLPSQVVKQHQIKIASSSCCTEAFAVSSQTLLSFDGQFCAIFVKGLSLGFNKVFRQSFHTTNFAKMGWPSEFDHSASQVYFYQHYGMCVRFPPCFAIARSPLLLLWNIF